MYKLYTKQIQCDIIVRVVSTCYQFNFLREVTEIHLKYILQYFYIAHTYIIYVLACIFYTYNTFIRIKQSFLHTNFGFLPSK